MTGTPVQRARAQPGGDRLRDPLGRRCPDSGASRAAAAAAIARLRSASRGRDQRHGRPPGDRRNLADDAVQELNDRLGLDVFRGWADARPDDFQRAAPVAWHLVRPPPALRTQAQGGQGLPPRPMRIRRRGFDGRSSRAPPRRARCRLVGERVQRWLVRLTSQLKHVARAPPRAEGCNPADGGGTPRPAGGRACTWADYGSACSVHGTGPLAARPGSDLVTCRSVAQRRSSRPRRGLTDRAPLRHVGRSPQRQARRRQAGEYGSALDRGVDQVARRVAMLERRRLRAELESLTIALARDLIGPDDFVRRSYAS